MICVVINWFMTNQNQLNLSGKTVCSIVIAATFKLFLYQYNETTVIIVN